MRRIGMAVAALAIGLTGGAARAGVYDLHDAPARFPALQFAHSDILLVLQPLRAAALPLVPEGTPETYKQTILAIQAKPAADLTTMDRLTVAACCMRLGRYPDARRVLADADPNVFAVRMYQEQAELEAKSPSELTTEDRINLGACYVRLGRFNDAVNVLTPADPNHFMVQANLAAAYQGLGFLGRAVGCQEEALSHWPSEWPGWSGGQLTWYRRVEGYYLKLLRLRQGEGEPPPPWTTMDALFDPPRRPAEPREARYEAEIETWKLWGNLPPDAYAVVAQLLIWSPTDYRLYWQLGELLNAMGYVQDAHDVLDDLIGPLRVSVKDVKDHRDRLEEALPVVHALSVVQADPPKFQQDFHSLMWALSPRGLLLPPVGGDLANEAAMAARAEAYAAQSQQKPGPPPPSPNAAAGWWPDWRPMFVGFAAGVILATLGALQWTEWRRRHAAALAAARPAPPPPQRTEPAAHDAGVVAADAPPTHDRVEGAP